MTILKSKGSICILSSPSGAGKTTIAKHIASTTPHTKLSVSYTTRPARHGETNGVDYHFVTHKVFLDMVAQGKFLEYTTIYDNFYGTAKAPIISHLNDGIDILFDIDWHGAKAIKAAFPEDTITIFVMPPSIEILRQRLHSRSSGNQDHINERIANAIQEIAHYKEYDFIIVNDQLERTIMEINNIIHTEKLRLERIVEMEEFVAKLG